MTPVDQSLLPSPSKTRTLRLENSFRKLRLANRATAENAADMVQEYLRGKHLDQAIEILDEMELERRPLPAGSYYKVFKHLCAAAETDLDRLTRFLKRMQGLGVLLHEDVALSLVAWLARQGEPVEGMKVLESCYALGVRPSDPILRGLVAPLVKLKNFDGAMSLLSSHRQSAACWAAPGPETCALLMPALRTAKRLDLTLALLELAGKHACPDGPAADAIVTAFLRSKDTQSTFAAFRTLERRCGRVVLLDAFNVLLAQMAAQQDLKQALELVDYMEQTGKVPNVATTASLLDVLSVKAPVEAILAYDALELSQKNELPVQTLLKLFKINQKVDFLSDKIKQRGYELLDGLEAGLGRNDASRTALGAPAFRMISAFVRKLGDPHLLQRIEKWEPAGSDASKPAVDATASVIDVVGCQ